VISNIAIRKALATEVETLASLAFVTWDRDLRPFLSGIAANKAVERKRLVLATHELLDRMIVAEIDGIPVGWCARARRRNYIPYLFVTPQLQSRGIGTLLLRRMETLMELENAERVQLDTLADNVRAVSFYQKHGYQILVLKGEGRNGPDAGMSVRLEKRLSPYRGPLDEAED
jgi:ribosomal-protein-alanine N-acetyltransferase